jgi:SAM-dependent methyltransferase
LEIAGKEPVLGKPQDYAGIAATYVTRRWAVSWKLQPLVDALHSMERPSEVVDVGCGTGDYLFALQQEFPSLRYRGVDISPEMLESARKRCPWAKLEIVNVDEGLTGETGTTDFIYSIDVLHHLQDYDRYFGGCARVLRTGGRLIVITDSEADIYARTLGKFFPETIRINLLRYPAIEELLHRADNAGLQLQSRRTARGSLDLDERVMCMLADRSISELRLIHDRDHDRGMNRVQMAKINGEKWISQTTVLEWSRP